jgi:hypothetical protein
MILTDLNAFCLLASDNRTISSTSFCDKKYDSIDPIFSKVEMSNDYKIIYPQGNLIN